jgi:hypothetical protein
MHIEVAVIGVIFILIVYFICVHLLVYVLTLKTECLFKIDFFNQSFQFQWQLAILRLLIFTIVRLLF